MLLNRRNLVVGLLAMLSACSSNVPPIAEVGPMLQARLEQQWRVGAPAREAAFSDDGTLLATSDAAGQIVLRRTGDWEVTRRISHVGGATALAFSPQGRNLFSAGYDGAVRAWDVVSGREIGVLRGPQGTVWSLSLSPDGRRLAAAGEDRLIHVWDLGGQAAPMRLSGHQLNIWEVRFSPDGRRLASASFDSTIRLWDADTGATIRTISGHGQAVVGLGWSPDGRMIATGSDDSTVRFWRSSDGAALRVMDNVTHAHKVAFSPDGRWLASAGRARGGIGTVWHGLTGLGGAGAPVHLWRVSDGALVQALPHPDDAMYVAFSADGRWLVTGGEDGVVRVWRLVE